MQGASLSCPCFQLLLHAALRALLDRLGVATFNVGIFNISPGGGREAIAAPDLAPGSLAEPGFGGSNPPVLARCAHVWSASVRMTNLAASDCL